MIDGNHLDRLAQMDELVEVLRHLLDLLGRDSFRTIGAGMPSQDEWADMEEPHRRLILKAWLWSETEGR